MVMCYTHAKDQGQKIRVKTNKRMDRWMDGVDCTIVRDNVVGKYLTDGTTNIFLILKSLCITQF